MESDDSTYLKITQLITQRGLVKHSFGRICTGRQYLMRPLSSPFLSTTAHTFSSIIENFYPLPSALSHHDHSHPLIAPTSTTLLPTHRDVYRDIHPDGRPHHLLHGLLPPSPLGVYTGAAWRRLHQRFLGRYDD